jgi:hypothetical protein
VGALNALLQYRADFIVRDEVRSRLSRPGAARYCTEQKIPTQNHSCPRKLKQTAKPAIDPSRKEASERRLQRESTPQK